MFCFVPRSKNNIAIGILFIFLFPMMLLAQGFSSGYTLGQEGTGYIEMNAESPDYNFKAVIGEPIVGNSESSNYKLDQGKTWRSITCAQGTVLVGSTCISTGSPNGSGGSGSGAGNEVSDIKTEAIFIGHAFPNSKVELLKDGQLVATTIAGSDAKFNISVKGYNTGNHNFTIIGKDRNSKSSIPVSYNLLLSEGVTTTVSGIYIAPTIAVGKKIVKKGENIAIFGQTTPESNVIISVHSPVEFFRDTNSDDEGVFLYNFDTSILNKGVHEAKAKASSLGTISSFGQTVSFEVGDVTLIEGEELCAKKGDINNDCKVNIVDLSIAAFWFNKDLSSEFILVENRVLNSDSKIDLVDFSIMAFYWTG